MRKQVTQLTCARCGRDELVEGEIKDRVVKVTFHGKEKTLEDLCTPCEGIVEKAIETIFKEMKKESPVRVTRVDVATTIVVPASKAAKIVMPTVPPQAKLKD